MAGVIFGFGLAFAFAFALALGLGFDFASASFFLAAAKSFLSFSTAAVSALISFWHFAIFADFLLIEISICFTVAIVLLLVFLIYYSFYIGIISAELEFLY
jgi:hypothetical protein